MGCFLLSVIVTALVALPASAKLIKPSPQTIVVFGDSLSAGYGLLQNQGWVALLQARITQQKRPYTVINASISGETTSGGLARFNTMLASQNPALWYSNSVQMMVCAVCLWATYAEIYRPWLCKPKLLKFNYCWLAWKFRPITAKIQPRF